jgi:hypothetical protein
MSLEETFLTIRNDSSQTIDVNVQMKIPPYYWLYGPIHLESGKDTEAMRQVNDQPYYRIGIRGSSSDFGMEVL